MKKLSIILGLLISIAAVWLSVKGIDWGKLGPILAHSNYWYLVPGVAAIMISIYLRAFRWRLLLHPRRDLSIRQLFWGLGIGYLFLNLLPVRAGELARVFAVEKTQHIPKAQGVSSILVERVLDVFAVLLLFVLVTPFVNMPDWLADSAFAVFAVFTVITALLMVLSLAKVKRVVVRILQAIPFVGKLAWPSIVENLGVGFAVLRNPKVLLGAFAYSLICWLLIALATWCALVGTGASNSLTVAIFSLCTTTLSLVIPSTPGSIGVYHYFAILSLTVLGINREVAFSFAILAHAVNYITVAAFGVIALFASGLRISDFARLNKAHRLPAKD